MIKKYRAIHHSGTIAASYVTRETDSSVFIVSGLGAELRRAKATDYESYHDTFEEAREALRTRLMSDLARAEHRVAAIKANLLALDDLEEES